MIGETISHYRITEKLGEGGMGVVYLAEDTTLGRRVAIKFLSSTAKEYRARFLREARAVSVLTHPNIATVYDYGETEDDQPYIVMELIRGQPLNEKLHEGSLPLTEAVRIVSLICEALGEAHHQGVIHRDIKPSNVVITERGQVKVLDFGLVKQLSEQHSLSGGDPNLPTLPSTRTRSDVIVGTPMYLSPEQATGKKVDARSDLFALGVVLYECITGHPAFEGSSIFEIGGQVLHVTPPLPSSINTHVSPELDRITMKAIEKKPDSRYQNAAEFIADLRKVVPDLAADGYRQTRVTGALAKQRTYPSSALTTIAETFRKPGPSIGTLIVAVIAVAVLGWIIVRWLRPGPYVPNAEAKSWYEKGADAMRNSAFLQATNAFEQAIAKDPNFPLAHARLAEAWNELDYADKAKDEMLKVQALVPNRSQLDKNDRLHLEAINATLTRNHAAAIEAYKELVSISPNDPQVYVDLGRAYEKNDQTDQAIKSYVEATTRSAQYAPAFLRVGTLYARKLDQASATAAFDKAETIYRADGNFEGQAEVSFQRGFLFDQLGKSAEAQTNLQRALELARTTGNDYQSVKTLLKLGDLQMDSANAEAARKYIREGLDYAQQKGIDNLYKRGLVDLGNTYLIAGDYPNAEKYYNESLDLSRRQHDDRNAARALLSLASAEDRLGHPEQVVANVKAALPFYEKGGYRKETLQSFILLGRAQLVKGEYDGALQSFQQELKLAQELGDTHVTMAAHQDIGRLQIAVGNYPEALKRLDESYQLAKSLNLPKTVAQVLIDRANALWRLGKYPEAEALMNEAGEIALQPDAAKNLVAFYHVSLAHLRLSQGQAAQAQREAEKAQAAGTKVMGFEVESNYTIGAAQVLAGDRSRGEKTCQKAVDDARNVGDPDLLTQSLLFLADSKVRAGDFPGAAKDALEAQQLSARSGRHDCEWIAWLIAARASVANRESDKAAGYITHAKEILAGLEQQWGSDYYNSYLKRPDVDTFRKQLEE
ncbi:MAG TPA: tetratricopeptide repeat protein, partial [Pyrinomonadaceae bacterium]|nr:tetratricopeptide repeat protein [Pyrinomonadaceae bacterium]